MELANFCRENINLPKDSKGNVSQASLPAPWPEVALIIMQYITLDKDDSIVWSFHFDFLNHLKGMKINAFMHNWIRQQKILKKGVEPAHQGLIMVLFKHYLNQMGLGEKSDGAGRCKS